MPSFFDAVIPIEDTELVSSSSDSGENVLIKLTKTMKTNQFIREKGSDIKNGEVVLEKNQVLKAVEIGLLASIGKISDIRVYSKPIIGIISTGNELV